MLFTEIVHCLLMIPHALNNATVQNLTVKYYREIQCTPLRDKHHVCQSVHFFIYFLVHVVPVFISNESNLLHFCVHVRVRTYVLLYAGCASCIDHSDIGTERKWTRALRLLSSLPPKVSWSRYFIRTQTHQSSV